MLGFLFVWWDKNEIMKWIPVFCYCAITWIVKYLINLLEVIWHLDTKHFSYYGTHFLTIEDIKTTKVEHSITKTCDGFNFIERFIFKCVGKRSLTPTIWLVAF